MTIKKEDRIALLFIVAVFLLSKFLSTITGLNTGYFIILVVAVLFLNLMVRGYREFRFREFVRSLKQIRGGNLLLRDHAEILAGKDQRRLRVLNKAIRKGISARVGDVPVKVFDRETGGARTVPVGFFNT